MVLVRGLSRSTVSCLTVSDRSTIPVVMLVFRDLKKLKSKLFNSIEH